MRVAYFSESLYPHVDGVSRTLSRLFDTLQTAGVDFLVFSPFVPAGDVAWADRVRRVPFVRFPPYPDYRVSLPYARGVSRDLAAFAPDLLHLVSPTPLAHRAKRLGRKLNTPVVASFHTHFVSYFKYYGVGPLEPIGWSLLRSFYGGCERIYVPSASIGRELGARRIGPVEIWSRGIDLAGFSPDHRDSALIREAGGGPGKPILLVVSRLVKEKDLADLIDVDRHLRGWGVEFTFVFVGDGPLRPKLQRALPHAYFAGHQNGEGLARWYASGDVFIFPSTTETLGNVVLEALASGLPAIVSDRGGPQDLVVDGENGFIVEANDSEGMAAAARRILENAALRRRMSVAARASAAPRVWEEINQGLLRSYEDVVTGWRKGG